MTNNSYEEFACAFDCHEPNNYTRTPNIIDHLTYDDIDEETGLVTVKRLSVYAAHLYRVIRSIAGQENITWRSAEKLAELANMSEGQVSKCKKELQKSFHQLDGKPLIKIEEREKTKLKDGKKLNGTIYHVIIVLSIWNHNRVFFLLQKFKKNEAGFPQKPADEAGFRREDAPQEAGFLSEGNNIQDKIPLSKEQDSAETALVVSSNTKKRLFPSDEKKRVYEYLLKEGCQESTAYTICLKYSVEEFSNSLNYTNKIFKKNPKNNRWGYLQSVLKNKYWSSAGGTHDYMGASLKNTG